MGKASKRVRNPPSSISAVISDESILQDSISLLGREKIVSEKDPEAELQASRHVTILIFEALVGQRMGNTRITKLCVGPEDGMHELCHENGSPFTREDVQEFVHARIGRLFEDARKCDL